MTIPRRAFLGIGVSTVGAGLAGCVSDSGDGTSPAPGERETGETASSTRTETPTPTETMPTEIRLWLKEVSLTESERGSVDPIQCDEMSDGEKRIVQTAIERGTYTSEIGAESSALETLRRRIGDRNPGGLAVYLTCRETYYRVGLVNGDHIVAHPDH